MDNLSTEAKISSLNNIHLVDEQGEGEESGRY
jgi:hypothetical protein